jgi:hypothetical protein
MQLQRQELDRKVGKGGQNGALDNKAGGKVPAGGADNHSPNASVIQIWQVKIKTRSPG